MHQTDRLNAGEGVIRTASGKYLNVFDPQPQHIDINDIIAGLEKTCRFSGQMNGFYSVLEHSVEVYQRATNITQVKNSLLMCLLHDAAEAYLGDIPSPVKKLLPDYNKTEKHLIDAIYKRFGVDPDAGNLVKYCDIEALAWEWENVVLKTRRFNWFYKWRAKRNFIRIFKKLVHSC